MKVLSFASRNENDSHSSVLFTTPKVENSGGAFLGDAVRVELFTNDSEAAHADDRRMLSRAAPLTFTGSSVADFTLPDLDAREVTLSNLRGKVVLLDFWGAWCG